MQLISMGLKNKQDLYLTAISPQNNSKKENEQLKRKNTIELCTAVLPPHRLYLTRFIPE